MIPNDHLLWLLKEKCYKKGEFTLSSGRETDHYVNCKNVTLSGEGLYNVASSILEFIEPDVKAVAGLTLGADPLVAGVAMKKKIDGLIVRKEPKDHGTGQQVEGAKLPKGSKVTVLEDVTTTASSAIKAVNALRDEGYEVTRIVTLIDRQVDGDADVNVLVARCELLSVFDLSEVIA